MNLKEEIEQLTKPAVYDRIHFSVINDPNSWDTVTTIYTLQGKIDHKKVQEKLRWRLYDN